jgi:hypothetical protein
MKYIKGVKMKISEINDPIHKIAMNNISMRKLNAYISDMTFYNWSTRKRVPTRQYATLLRNYGVEDI